MELENIVFLMNRPEKHFLESLYFAKIKSGIDAALEGKDYNLLMVQQDTYLPDTLSRKTIKKTGVFNIAPHVNHPSLDLLSKEDIPTVLINCRSPKHNWVDADNIVGARTMTQHLVDLGHERILLVNGFRESQNAIDRLTGFKSVLEKQKIAFKPGMVLNCDFSITMAYEQMKEYLKQRKEPDFSAVFATNDYMAVGVVRALTDEGIRVPQDVAVVGYDDFDFTATLPVALTTYRQPFRNIGYLAAKFLLQMMEAKKHEQFQVELIGDLIVRDSCGAKIRKI